MSHVFQRPLCQMGAAYDYAFRPALGDPGDEAGGGCDDRPHRVELYSSEADPVNAAAAWRGFELCPEHESQLATFDARFQRLGRPSRFRSRPTP